MALVAYSDDSDLGSDSEDVEESPKTIVNGESKAKQLPESSKNREASSQIDPGPDPKAEKDLGGGGSGVADIVDSDDEDATTKRTTGLLAAIPRAKPIGTGLKDDTPLGAEVDEVTDVPTVETWKVTQRIREEGSGSQTSNASSASVAAKKKKEKKKIQFIIPSLSEVSFFFAVRHLLIIFVIYYQ